MTIYRSMSARIRRAKTLYDISKIEKSLDRLYNAGILTVADFKRLDTLLMERQAIMES